MIENCEINVGIVLSTTLNKWRKIEQQLSENADIVYVKRVPASVRLKIREMIGEEGEEENVRSERS